MVVESTRFAFVKRGLRVQIPPSAFVEATHVEHSQIVRMCHGLRHQLHVPSRTHWGTESREFAELSICVVCGAGWGSFLGQLLFMATELLARRASTRPTAT